ncbi:hypothetical protein [Chondromyces crocatus]|uniref:Knr4/Smi1-like domain-containing protein n=1 Tax=Chondromyces crocatus TaxID=52 RepID=A0A0K1EKR0_CHOCO|nr:hypothetical protein [Chondromyces crocatus]AKT41450.1 uncharacterized protein CMC5_056530 [Chondromyces crocatus]
MEALLKKLDAEIKSKAPATHGALRPPADAAALDRLAARFGGTAPPALVAWYTLHDGVEGGHDFDPNSTFFCLSIDEGLRVGRELLGEDKGHPLLSNGGGAWVCYAADGSLVAHRHGETWTFAPSLEAWVTSVTAALAQQKVTTIPAPRMPATWAPVTDLPSSTSVLIAFTRAAAVGTVVLKETLQPSGVYGELLVKAQPSLWLCLLPRSAADRAAVLEGAIAEWKTHHAAAPSWSSGYLKTDEQAAISLSPSPGTLVFRG